MSKDSLIKGTLILALAAFTARFLGMIVRAPLYYLLDDEGMASYGVANNIYLVLLVVATAGIPSALSKLVAEKLAHNRQEEAQRIFRAAIYFALTAGIVMTVALYGLAPTYGQLIDNPESTKAIQAIAPALLLFPLIAIMRGYFQGRQNMMAGGLSQIYEQFARVGTALLLAYLALHLGGTRIDAAAWASFGGVLGSVAAFAVMLYYWRKLKRSTDGQVPNEPHAYDEETPELKNYRDIYKHIFKLSLPIALFSMTVPLVYMIDSTILINLLKGQIGLEQAKAMLGQMVGKAHPLAGIPPILAIALSMSIIPIISSAYAKKNLEEVAASTAQVIRISLLSGLPVILMIIAAARPINGLLFPELTGTDLIIWLTGGSIFQIIMMTSGAVLMGMGLTHYPMLHAGAGIVVKIAFSFLLAQWLGVYGIMLATTLCFLLAMQLNVRSLRKRFVFHIFGNRWPGFGAAAAIALSVGIAVEFGIFTFVPGAASKLGYLASAGMVSLLTGWVYVVLLFRLGVIKQAEWHDYPAKVQKLFRLLTRFSI